MECVGPGGSTVADRLNTERLLLKAGTRGGTQESLASCVVADPPDEHGIYCKLRGPLVTRVCHKEALKLCIALVNVSKTKDQYACISM